jgi:large subunit ribosomal protein L28
MVGHSVSHSNIKTKRRFLPSLKSVKVASEALGQTFSLRISNAALRTLDYKGGLDPFIVKARDEQLSAEAQRIKRKVKAKLAENAAA